MAAFIAIVSFLALGYYIFKRFEETNKGPFFGEDNED